jgi:hypothetical protein
LSDLGSNITIFAVGSAATYIGGILPSPLDVISRVLGVSAVGYSLYKVFGPPAPLAPPGPAKTNPLFEAPSGPLPFKPEDLTVKLDDTQSRQGGVRRAGMAMLFPTWLGGGYQGFDFTIRNNTPRKLELFAGLKITDNEGHIIWQSYPSSDNPWFGRHFFEVPPLMSGVDSKDQKNYVQGTLWTDQTYFMKEVFVQVELFRTTDEGEKSYKESAPLEIIFGPLG